MCKYDVYVFNKHYTSLIILNKPQVKQPDLEVIFKN